MANDPHRDFLPVKDSDDRSTRGGNCRADYHAVAKLKRSDLEDRYMRLYDENTQIKKLLNCQEEKIKRLGAKLLRLIGDKKGCSDNYRRKQDAKAMDELQMRIIELEHENYILKDKNMVLKQQLANHSRQHVAAHRSPNRSVHTSPRISQRQSSAPNINDANYVLSNRNQPHNQLQEAEEHIQGLNEEIKSLHRKIDALQQDLEKSALESQKTKVTENIELIRLQRSLKQQSIQIASLVAQNKNAEKNQKLLRDELAAAHRENEESLQIISDKQKEILELYTKLEEKSLYRLEQEEMKERIHDLTTERDALRERGEFLMRTIEEKSNESDIVNELKQMLAMEKSKKEELKQSLENSQKILNSIKDASRLSQSSSSDEFHSKNVIPTKDFEPCRCVLPAKEMITNATQTEGGDVLSSSTQSNLHSNELNLLSSTQLIQSFDERIFSSDRTSRFSSKNEEKRLKSIGIATDDLPTVDTRPGCNCSVHKRYILKDVATSTEVIGPEVTELKIPDASLVKECELRKTYEAEAMNMERELEYVKQMLRSQTQRCEAQEEEISRLKSELKICNERYNDTMKRLDLHLKIVRNMEARTGKAAGGSTTGVIPENKYVTLLEGFNEEASFQNIEEKEMPKPRTEVNEKKESNSAENDPKKSVEDDIKNESRYSLDRLDSSRIAMESRLSFVHKKFLESSDEEDDDDDEVEFKRRASLGEKSIMNFILEKKTGAPVVKGQELQEKATARDPTKDSNEAREEIKAKTKDDESSHAESSTSGKVMEVRGTAPGHPPKIGGNITICIEWLKLSPDTSVWYNDNVKLLFVDFSFLDFKGEEAETPTSLKKPKKAVDKCHFNFSKSIEVTDYRYTALQVLRDKPNNDVIVFKIVSEPDESGDENECVDIGVATVKVQQFFDSKPNTSLLLQVKNIIDMKEIIGILSISLDVTAIL